MGITLIIIFVILVMFLFVWLIAYNMKQVAKDWETLDELKQKANTVNTKEEIEEFHTEFVEKARKIHNQYIQIELQRIDGYLRGLYKQFKN